jgi:acyl-CoA dehydrogenase
VSELPTMVALGEDYPELRESVRKICERYPGAYWRKLEAEQAYPTEFITELTQAGFLASLIPEELWRLGIAARIRGLSELKVLAASGRM